MGGAPSIADPLTSKTILHKNEREIMDLMMPIYYDSGDVTPEERKSAFNSWDLILHDKSPEFLAKKEDPSFPHQSAMSFFYDTFYFRLFDVHPMCRVLFKNGMKSLARFVVMLMGIALSVLEAPEKYDKTLRMVAEGHYKLGVKTVEYGLMGEVLFWSLKRCLGIKAYTPPVHWAWVKVYSRMLRTIIPVAVALELKGQSESQLQRFTLRETIAVSAMDLKSGEENLDNEKLRQAEPVQG